MATQRDKTARIASAPFVAEVVRLRRLFSRLSEVSRLQLRRCDALGFGQLAEFVELFLQAVTEGAFAAELVEQGVGLLERLFVPLVFFEEATKAPLDFRFGKQGCNP